jgi:hypothetical protein
MEFRTSWPSLTEMRSSSLLNAKAEVHGDKAKLTSYVYVTSSVDMCRYLMELSNASAPLSCKGIETVNNVPLNMVMRCPSTKILISVVSLVVCGWPSVWREQASVLTASQAARLNGSNQFQCPVLSGAHNNG